MTPEQTGITTPMYTSTRVPPEETPDRTASPRAGGESRSADEPVSVARVMPAATQ